MQSLPLHVIILSNTRVQVQHAFPTCTVQFPICIFTHKLDDYCLIMPLSLLTLFCLAFSIIWRGVNYHRAGGYEQSPARVPQILGQNQVQPRILFGKFRPE